MKSIKTSRIKAITALTAEDFETRMNDALEEIASLHSSYSIHFNMSMGHVAYIEYHFTTDIPENLEDEYRLRGERYFCRNCPYFTPSFDGRTQHGKCDYGVSRRPAPDHGACETFYEHHHDGSWKARYER